MCVSRAASSMCVDEGGAGPYFFLHSAVVCDVDAGWLVHEPAGCLAAAGEPFAVPTLAAAVVSFDLPTLCAGEAEVGPLPYCLGWDTSYRMARLSSAPAANMSMVPAWTALHHLRW